MDFNFTPSATQKTWLSGLFQSIPESAQTSRKAVNANLPQLSPLLGRFNAQSLEKKLGDDVCRHCEKERIRYLKTTQDLVLKPKGRELNDRDLFPLQHLNIECNHKGRLQSSENAGKTKKPDSFFTQMDNMMTARTAAGSTRYK